MLKVAIANCGPPVPSDLDFAAAWSGHVMPRSKPRHTLFDQPTDWGFHIYAIGVYLMDHGLADRVEFWRFAKTRATHYHVNGVLRIAFHNERDVAVYIDGHGAPDLFINYGREGEGLLGLLEGRSFRVHVPCLRRPGDDGVNRGAECYLVDSGRFLDARSMLYVPVVNTRKIRPRDVETERDFIYLASAYPGKRHDLLLDAVRGTELTGHLHPVNGALLDLSGTKVTTSDWNETPVADLLATSRIAVYPADCSSNPASMWECVAAGLPIVVNERIEGGEHVVVPGVTGELAPPDKLGDVMRHVLAHRDTYRPREYFEKQWDTVPTLERYLAFFEAMGWKRPRLERCS
jgi:hypothetical protein